MNTTESVLQQADPQSLEDLIGRDPLELSDQDVDKIVNMLRKDRENFVLEEKKKKNAPAKKEAPVGGLTLDHLDINLEI